MPAEGPTSNGAPAASAPAAPAGSFALAPGTTNGGAALDLANTVARPVERVSHEGIEIEPTPASNGSLAINVARVLDSAQGSEMRVGMRTPEFGNVQVSTSLGREEIAAQITYDHGDLGRLLATHLPAVQEKLGAETGLHATVQVVDRGAGGPGSDASQSGGQAYPGAGAHSGSPSGSGQSSSGQGYAGQRSAVVASAPGSHDPGAAFRSTADPAAGPELGRLDVRA